MKLAVVMDINQAYCSHRHPELHTRNVVDITCPLYLNNAEKDERR